MNKLIIHHGERITEHELGAEALVIGRDPECELFFADRKLSRQHARIEPEPEGSGFRIVDLASRNGSWVNEERIRERPLRNGDQIRLGGVHITVEVEAPPRVDLEEKESEEREDDGDESTVFLDTAPIPDASGTVALDPRQSPPPAPPPIDERTVALRSEDAAALTDSSGTDASATRALSTDQLGHRAPDVEDEDDGDETRQRGGPPAGPEQTVALPGESRRPPTDTGTVMFRSTVAPEIEEVSRAASGHRGAPGWEDELGGSPLSPPRGYLLRLAALVAVAALFAVAVLAVPLMRTLGAALAEESELRGRALVGLLAAANATALGRGQVSEVTVDRVAGEYGVTGAFVLDTSGEVVAPPDRAGETLELGALDAPLVDVRRLSTGRSESGELVLAEPVRYRGRRVGVAVVTLSTASAGWSALALVLGSALLLMGLATAVFLTNRLTLAPVRDLQRDVESLPETRPRLVSTERPFVELEELARSVNRLLGRRDGDGSAPETPGASVD